MIAIFRNYSNTRKVLQTEPATVGKWDIWNGTSFRTRVESGKLTAEEVAGRMHADGKCYTASLFKADGDAYPAVFLEIMLPKQFIAVHFIDAMGRNSLIHHFSGATERPGGLFLTETWYYQFRKAEDEDEIQRLHYRYDERGNIRLRRYDEKHERAIDYEGKVPVDVSGLYEPLPDFGAYESIAQKERDLTTPDFPA